MSACAQSAMQRKPTAAHKHGGSALRRAGVKAECECTECAKKKRVLQRAAVNENAPEHVPDIVYDVLRSPGQPLDRGTREFMEGRFNHDFSAVRVHTYARAAESARAVSARAYAAGSDIVFGLNEYRPATLAGKQLLAHELAHVVLESSSSGRRAGRLAAPVEADGAISVKPSRLNATTSQFGVLRRTCVAGGAKQSKSIVRVALTIDDGPTERTMKLRERVSAAAAGSEQLRNKKAKPRAGDKMTFFVMWNQVDRRFGKTNGMEILKEIQIDKGEIAIHSPSESVSHRPWMPIEFKDKKGKITRGYDKITGNVENDKISKFDLDFERFVRMLINKNINVNFARMPGGWIFTEKPLYRNKLIGMGLSKYEAESVLNDSFESLKTLLARWGISYIDWDAEISGNKSRDDNFTDAISPARKEKEKPNSGRFEKAVRNVKGKNKSEFMVVLAHETSDADVAAIEQDVIQMEKYANLEEVRIEYCTLTELRQIGYDLNLVQKNHHPKEIHRKLIVGSADDPAEQAADTMANRVLSELPLKALQ